MCCPTACLVDIHWVNETQKRNEDIYGIFMDVYKTFLPSLFVDVNEIVREDFTIWRHDPYWRQNRRMYRYFNISISNSITIPPSWKRNVKPAIPERKRGEFFEGSRTTLRREWHAHNIQNQDGRKKKSQKNLSRFPILKLARRLGLMYVTSIDKKKRDGDGK